MHDIVLALPPGEVHPRDPLIGGTAVHRGGEPIGDPRQRGRRGDRQAELPVHVTHQPASELQLRDIHVEVHPVDALDLEDHVL